MKVLLPDQSTLELEDGATGHEAAAAIGPGLAKAAVALKVDGQMQDLALPLSDGAAIEIVTKRSGEDYLYVMRHSAAHVMAEAVQTIVPGTKFGFGPPIDDGFYYDFDLPRPVTDEDFPAIEAEINRIIKAKAPFQRSVMSIPDAREYFAEREDPYKVDQIDALESQGEHEVSLYRQRDFIDLCRGPHLKDSGRIGAVKLLSVAGAYWRGDENNAQLTRIYATAFANRGDLEAHLERLEVARQQDHRRVGKQMGLFHFDDAGPGFPFFLPAGMTVVNGIKQAVRDELDDMGYGEVQTPTMLSSDLWDTSGHNAHYRENMYYTEVDEKEFAVKPMNCPGACLIYRSDRHSYRDLPLRFAEFGHVHRHELSGALHGLFRVRAFTQDDAHVFCRLDQVREEVNAILDLTDRFYGRFGFEDVALHLSTRPEKATGESKMWDQAEAALKDALGDREHGIKEGDGAFYGPKIDFEVTDTMGREWQLGTCQLDFYLPERFGLVYTTADDSEERPVMIHRAITGSIERFLGILIENTGGDFPFWLAPVHARALPIADRHVAYAARVAQELERAGLRIDVDARGESVGKRIRDGELDKIPYLLVIGDREEESGQVAVRGRGGRDEGALDVDALAERLAAEAAA